MEKIPSGIKVRIAKLLPIEEMEVFLTDREYHQPLSDTIQFRRRKMLFVEGVTDYMQNGETIGECYNRLVKEEIDDPLESMKFSWLIGDWEKELRKADGINGLFLEWEEIFGEADISNGLFTNVTSNLLFAYTQVMDERRSSSSLEMIYKRILNIMQENENIQTTTERLEEEEADHGFLIDVFDMASAMGRLFTSRKVQGLYKIELKMHLQLLIQCKLEQ